MTLYLKEINFVSGSHLLVITTNPEGCVYNLTPGGGSDYGYEGAELYRREGTLGDCMALCTIFSDFALSPVPGSIFVPAFETVTHSDYDSPEGFYIEKESPVYAFCYDKKVIKKFCHISFRKIARVLRRINNKYPRAFYLGRNDSVVLYHHLYD